MKKKQTTQVVIVGGGFGGVKAAMELANKPGFEVTLISDTTNFEYHGALYRTATGRSPMEVVIPLREIFARAKNVTVVLDRITKLNPKAKSIKSESGTMYPYDTLILALGNVINYFGLEGMEEKAFCVNTIKHTIALRHELITRFKSGKQVSVTIIGGGPSGVEMAGELDNFAKKVTTKYQKKYVQPKVTLIEGADRLLSVFDPVLSAKVYKRLYKLGVDIRLSTKVNSCETGKVCLDTGDIQSDVIIWTAGTKLPDFYSQNSTLFKLERGRIAVDGYLRPKGQSDIFVIGDNAATQFSGMAQTALYDAVFVAQNLINIRKKAKAKAYKPKRPVYIVPVGSAWAVYQSEKHQISGYRGWLYRRQADLAILRSFTPYKQALKRWRKGNSAAHF
jgi:NADH dehydrogenase